MHSQQPLLNTQRRWRSACSGRRDAVLSLPVVVNRGVDLLGTDGSTQFGIAERTHANEVMPMLLEEIGADQPVEDDCR